MSSMIDGFKKSGGRQFARATCSDCGAKHEFPCIHDRDQGRNGVVAPVAGQANRKLVEAGWKVKRNHLTCPACVEAKGTHKQEEAAMTATTENAPARGNEPTRQQKREIMEMLDTAYDTRAERYHGSDTDDTVADCLGVMPAWVAQIREEFFGPVGGNEEMAELLFEMRLWAKEADVLATAYKEAWEGLSGHRAKVSTFEARIEKITNALSRRITKQA